MQLGVSTLIISIFLFSGFSFRSGLQHISRISNPLNTGSLFFDTIGLLLVSLFLNLVFYALLNCLVDLDRVIFPTETEVSEILRQLADATEAEKAALSNSCKILI